MKNHFMGGKSTPSPASPESFNTFGDLLKYLRRRAQLTQRDLSIAVGYSEPQISYLEKNHRLPDVSTVSALFIPALGLEHEPIWSERLLLLAREAHILDERYPGEPPYKGLEYFDTSDASIFYGRELLTARLASHLREEHFLAIVVGASGSGKSSIVRAGLIPVLMKLDRLADGSLPPRGAANWKYHIISPGAQPLESLAALFFENSSSGPEKANFVQSMLRDHRSLHEQFVKSSTGRKVLLVVDQFEELFSLCGDEQLRTAFIDNLLFVTSNEANDLARALITLRADFYANCAQYENLRDAISKNQEFIGPMSPAELRRAIEQPALINGWDLEEGLVDLILRDVGNEPGALPLVSHALLETWKRRRVKMLTITGYTEAGGVKGAIAHTADALYQELEPNQQLIARRIFLQLTELGRVSAEDGLATPDTRRRATLDEIIPVSSVHEDVDLVLQKLADARLITLGRNTAEVAHEALIREWPVLRQWLANDRGRMTFYRQLADDAREWSTLSRRSDLLYRGARLAEALEWSEESDSGLGQLESEFISASQAEAQAAEREKQAQVERELIASKKLSAIEHDAARRLMRRAIYLAGALIVAVVLAGFAFFLSSQSDANAQLAQTEQSVAFSRELSALAVSSLAADPERSILLSLLAVKTSLTGGKPALVDATDALHRSLQASRVLATLRGHTSQVQGLAVSPDGKRLASFSDDGTIKIWDAVSRTELLTIPTGVTTTELQRFISFSPDGKRVASPAGERLARVWDVASGSELLTLRGHTHEVTTAIFSPDGARIVTASYDQSAIIWDAQTGKQLHVLVGQGQEIVDAIFSPDGSRIYTTSDVDGVVIAWNAITGEQIFKINRDNSAHVLSLAVSPDGKQLATAEFDTSIKIWDTANGSLLRTLYGHVSQVAAVDYSPDGQILVSAGEDGTARTWDANSGKGLQILAGHTSGVLGVGFSSGGNDVVTASRDKTLKIWDISAKGGSDGLNLVGHTSRVYDIGYRPGGGQIATWGYDGTVRVWDAATGSQVLKIAHADLINGGNISYSPDGRFLALVGSKAPILLDAGTGKEIPTAFNPFKDSVNLIVFSPDGKRIAAGCIDGTVRVYDIEKGNTQLEFTASSTLLQQLVFSPDGSKLASANIDSAAVWDANTGAKLITFKGHGEGVRTNDIVFSRDGRWIASTGNDSTVKIWATQTGKVWLTLTGHTGATFGAAFSPDGHTLATSSVDRTIKIWSLPEQGDLVPDPLTLYGNSGAVYHIAFSPDGTRIASAGRDPVVHVYELGVDNLVALARSRLTRSLTQEECQIYLHLLVCPAVP